MVKNQFAISSTGKLGRGGGEGLRFTWCVHVVRAHERKHAARKKNPWRNVSANFIAFPPSTNLFSPREIFKYLFINFIIPLQFFLRANFQISFYTQRDSIIKFSFLENLSN